MKIEEGWREGGLLVETPEQRGTLQVTLLVKLSEPVERGGLGRIKMRRMWG